MILSYQKYISSSYAADIITAKNTKLSNCAAPLKLKQCYLCCCVCLTFFTDIQYKFDWTNKMYTSFCNLLICK